MPQFAVSSLLETPSVQVREVRCAGGCRHPEGEECSARTQLVFPLRGVYQRHVGRATSVADANHVLLFNADEAYRVSHPVQGGDDSLVVRVDPALLHELIPATEVAPGEAVRFRRQALPVDAATQAAVIRLRRGLRAGTSDTLVAESAVLALVARALRQPDPASVRATPGRRRLVDRAKLLLAADPAQRWSLAAIAAAVGSTPLYLTQSFRALEGLPLYRYQLRLRLAHALDRVAAGEDLSTLATELGFSSHSHFTAAFRQVHGLSPSAYRRTLPAHC
jgi:AraC family transcriptional regulator